MLIESFDALFGLPRKKSAGTSVRPPLHGNKVFYFQEDVDKFIKSYPTTTVVATVIDFECNESQLLPQDNDHDSNASSDEYTSTESLQMKKTSFKRFYT